MNLCHDNGSAGRRENGLAFPPNKVLKEVRGAACAGCGDPHYYLVLRIAARNESAVLAARCSHCHGTRGWLSEGRLVRDIERTA